MVQGEPRVWLTVSLMYSHQAVPLEAAEQGPVSAGEAVPVTGVRATGGPRSSTGLAESKVS